MQFEFHTLDVFTDRRFAGNPLAVVLAADGLSQAQMQTVAREFNLAETVFVLKPSNPAHSARMRIFTPATELPFAGHPIIGTAVLLADLRHQQRDGRQDALVTLEQEIGLVRVGVRLEAGRAPFAEFDAPKLPEPAGTLAPIEQLCAALGLLPNEIGFANHRPLRLSAGNAFAFVPVASLEAIARAHVRQPDWKQAFSGQSLNGAYLYCQETVHTASQYHARMFAPDLGVSEDPATGSAAVAFAGLIHRYDALPDGQHKRVIEQGYEMGRPSEVSIQLDVVRGDLHSVRIGGSAVRVSEGRLTI
jgi:trans-2,3-dihydro-3-hydroxyanthranilate isomerase